MEEDRELEADAIVLLRPALRSSADSPTSAIAAGESSSPKKVDVVDETRIWFQETPDCSHSSENGDRKLNARRPPRNTVQAEHTTLCNSGPTNMSRRRALSVLCIENGSVEKENLTASQLLQIVRNSVPGHDREQSGGLKLRDVRQISNTAVGSRRPAIEPRRGCVVLNMPSSIKALILAEKVILISTESPTDTPTTGLVRREASSHILDRLSMIARPLQTPTMPFNGNALVEPLLPDDPGYRIRPKHHHTCATMPFNVDDEFDEDAMSSDGSLQCSALVRKLVRLSAMQDTGPFEFLALEAILFEVIRKLTDELNPAIDVANRMRSTSTICTTSKLHQIRELKKLLQEGATKAEGISQALTEVLGSEEDIRRLELSRFRGDPQEWDEPSDSHGAEDVEILLESYQQDVSSSGNLQTLQIQGLVQQIEDADETLDLTIQMMQLQLATTRTTLLKFEIALQVIGVMIGLVSAIAGIFGMNLRNGWEDRKDIFWSMTIGMIGLILFSVVSTGSVARNLNL